MDDAIENLTANPFVRHRHHGQSVSARTHQDAAGAAFDLRASRGAQYRFPAGHRRQSCLPAATPSSPAMPLSPARQEDFFAGILPPAIGLIDAWLPNFGDCLLHAIDQILGPRASARPWCSMPTARTCRPRCWSRPPRCLREPGDRAVLGPSTDGGYYLLGLKTAHRRLFEDIAWSTESVAEQTLERAGRSGSMSKYCRPGTTSTTSRVCAGSAAKSAACPRGSQTRSRRAKLSACQRRHCCVAYGARREFVRAPRKPDARGGGETR